MEAAVDGIRSDGGLRQWWLSSMEAAVGWRDNDAMALVAMAPSADGEGSNGSHMVNCSWVVNAASTIL